MIGQAYMVSARAREASDASKSKSRPARHLKVGAGWGAHSDWIDLGLEDEDIMIC